MSLPSSAQHGYFTFKFPSSVRVDRSKREFKHDGISSRLSVTHSKVISCIIDNADPNSFSIAVRDDAHYAMVVDLHQALVSTLDLSKDQLLLTTPDEAFPALSTPQKEQCKQRNHQQQQQQQQQQQ